MKSYLDFKKYRHYYIFLGTHVIHLNFQYRRKIIELVS